MLATVQNSNYTKGTGIQDRAHCPVYLRLPRVRIGNGMSNQFEQRIKHEVRPDTRRGECVLHAQASLEDRLRAQQHSNIIYLFQ